MRVGFAQTQLPQQKAVTTVGRLPKMAAHVVLVQNQRERAAAMRGKALVFSALLLATDICATSAQSLFEQKVMCKKYADDFMIIIKQDSLYPNSTQTLSYNYHSKYSNCYVLSHRISKKEFSEIHNKNLYDALTGDLIATTNIEIKQNTAISKIAKMYESQKEISVLYDYVENYITDRMKTER